MTTLDLIKEPQQVITKIDMNDPLFEQKLAVAKKEETAVNEIVKQTADLFNAKVDVMGYNLIQGGSDTRLVLTLGISRKEVKNMPPEEVPVDQPAESAPPASTEAAPATPAAEDVPATAGAPTEHA